MRVSLFTAIVMLWSNITIGQGLLGQTSLVAGQQVTAKKSLYWSGNAYIRTLNGTKVVQTQTLDTATNVVMTAVNEALTIKARLTASAQMLSSLPDTIQAGKYNVQAFTPTGMSNGRLAWSNTKHLHIIGSTSDTLYLHFNSDLNLPPGFTVTYSGGISAKTVVIASDSTVTINNSIGLGGMLIAKNVKFLHGSEFYGKLVSESNVDLLGYNQKLALTTDYSSIELTQINAAYTNNTVPESFAGIIGRDNQMYAWGILGSFSTQANNNYQPEHFMNTTNGTLDPVLSLTSGYSNINTQTDLAPWLAVVASEKVYVMGHSGVGTFGNTSNNSNPIFQLNTFEEFSSNNPSFVNNNVVQAIAAGSTLVILKADGKVYTVGDAGLLGRPEPVSGPGVWYEYGNNIFGTAIIDQVPIPNNEKVIKIIANDVQVACITETGKLVTWGKKNSFISHIATPLSNSTVGGRNGVGYLAEYARYRDGNIIDNVRDVALSFSAMLILLNNGELRFHSIQEFVSRGIVNFAIGYPQTHWTLNTNQFVGINDVTDIWGVKRGFFIKRRSSSTIYKMNGEFKVNGPVVNVNSWYGECTNDRTSLRILDNNNNEILDFTQNVNFGLYRVTNFAPITNLAGVIDIQSFRLTRVDAEQVVAVFCDGTVKNWVTEDYDFASGNLLQHTTIVGNQGQFCGQNTMTFQPFGNTPVVARTFEPSAIYCVNNIVTKCTTQVYELERVFSYPTFVHNATSPSSDVVITQDPTNPLKFSAEAPTGLFDVKNSLVYQQNNAFTNLLYTRGLQFAPPSITYNSIYSYCSGSTVNIVPNSLVAGFTSFSWSITQNTSNVPVQATSSANSATVSFTVGNYQDINNTLQPATMTVVVTPKIGNVSCSPVSFVVEIYPEVLAGATTVKICGPGEYRDLSSYGQPAGGKWSGTGINNNVIYITPGMGQVPATYTYEFTTPNGGTISCSKTVNLINIEDELLCCAGVDPEDVIGDPNTFTFIDNLVQWTSQSYLIRGPIIIRDGGHLIVSAQCKVYFYGEGKELDDKSIDAGLRPQDGAFIYVQAGGRLTFAKGAIFDKLPGSCTGIYGNGESWKGIFMDVSGFVSGFGGSIHDNDLDTKILNPKTHHLTIYSDNLVEPKVWPLATESFISGTLFGQTQNDYVVSKVYFAKQHSKLEIFNQQSISFNGCRFSYSKALDLVPYNISVTNCYFEGSEDGVSISEYPGGINNLSTNSTLSLNVSGNVFNNCYRGIVLDNQTDQIKLTLTCNTFETGGFTGNRYGLYVTERGNLDPVLRGNSTYDPNDPVDLGCGNHWPYTFDPTKITYTGNGLYPRIAAVDVACGGTIGDRITNFDDLCYGLNSPVGWSSIFVDLNNPVRSLFNYSHFANEFVGSTNLLSSNLNLSTKQVYTNKNLLFPSFTPNSNLFIRSTCENDDRLNYTFPTE